MKIRFTRNGLIFETRMQTYINDIIDNVGVILLEVQKFVQHILQVPFTIVSSFIQSVQLAGKSFGLLTSDSSVGAETSIDQSFASFNGVKHVFIGVDNLYRMKKKKAYKIGLSDTEFSSKHKMFQLPSSAVC